jgi:septum formation protein
MTATANARATLILASTSRYRAQLLGRLGYPFEQLAPDCDETPLPAEQPIDLVQRLAVGKAQSLATLHPQAVVIGSDQVADFNGAIIGKPQDHADAVSQLRTIAGQRVVFQTGLCITRASDAMQRSCVVATTVQFRRLDDEAIERYLAADKPYDCACSFRSESLGSAIVESMTSDDPCALVGLPIIQVANWLHDFGIAIP